MMQFTIELTASNIASLIANYLLFGLVTVLIGNMFASLANATITTKNDFIILVGWPVTWASWFGQLIGGILRAIGLGL